MIRFDSDTRDTGSRPLTEWALRSVSRRTETPYAVANVKSARRNPTPPGVATVTYRFRRTGDVETEPIL
jgi:hypothetical protein